MEAEQRYFFSPKKAETTEEFRAQLCPRGDAKRKMVLGGFLLPPVLGTNSKSEFTEALIPWEDDS